MRPPAHIFEQIISKPRLDSYKGYWKVDADGAVGLYMWKGRSRCTLLKRIFPGHSLSQSNQPNWNTKAFRRPALDCIFELKEVRNRIAHHEPLWKFSKVMDTSTSPASITAAHSTCEATTIARFTRLLQIYDDAVAAMSPDLSMHIRASSWRRQLNFLLSERGRGRYKAGLHVLHDMPIAALALHQQFASVIQSNQPIKVQDAGGEGVFLPV